MNPNLRDSQLEILRIIYDHYQQFGSGISASQVQIALIRSGKDYAYPTIYSEMMKLHRKKIIHQSTNSFVAYFIPLVSRDSLAKQYIAYFSKQLNLH